MLTLKRKRLELTKGTIGLVSDTHGLVRPEALAALKGSELIIHAGDIGKPEVLKSLRKIAPVIAIRGNNDRDAWAKKIPDLLNLYINRVKIHVIHNVNELAVNPAADGFRAVVSGHSHKPRWYPFYQPGKRRAAPVQTSSYGGETATRSRQSHSEDP